MIGCERCSRFFKKDTNKTLVNSSSTLSNRFSVLIAFFSQANKYPLQYWQYFKTEIQANIRQLTRQLQWTATKAILGNLIFSFLENNRVQQGLTEKFNLLSSSLSFQHGGNDFRSGYITFDILNNQIFFDTVEKTNEK